jgi:uncharacterized protein (DUF2461 family)
MSNGYAEWTRRRFFLRRLRGFITAVARNYYCSSSALEKNGKQLASKMRLIRTVNVLSRVAAHLLYWPRHPLLRQVFIAEIADLSRTQ